MNTQLFQSHFFKNVRLYGSVFLCLFVFQLIVKAQESSAVEPQAVYAQGTWQDAQIRSIFEHLSEVSSMDFVIDPAVNGRITLSVKNKTWKEMCDIVCKMKQLIALTEDNYIYIMNLKDYLVQMQDKETGRLKLDEVKNLERELIKLDNTKTEDMIAPVKELLSSRGKVTAITHTNSLIIFDTRENIEKIRAMLKSVDIEVAQITIESRIIETNSLYNTEMGVQWNLFDDKIQHLPGKQMLTEKVLEKASYGILAPYRFNIALEYMLGDSKGRIVAQPQITTLDNKEARIFMGSQIPLTYRDVSGNTLVKMVDAGTELIVTPHIAGEGRILLNLKPTKKSYIFNPQNLPIINEQSAQTNVVVNDGETVVIAGLNSNDNKEAENGIPYLRKIPFIGNLFKKSSETKDKKDLVIFVTPHIVKRGLSPTSQSMDFGDTISTSRR